MIQPRDHGGGLDAAIAQYGGARSDWVDLSTGINPVPYPIKDIPQEAWTALPDQAAMDALLQAARQFWCVPGDASIIATHGASALIARMPDIARSQGAYIPTPTYNEHAAAFHARAPKMDQTDPQHDTHIFVHPNNPDGRFWTRDETNSAKLTIIDESFCDIAPNQSHIHRCDQPGTIILKSFGKFWGLAGLRLGFAIGNGLDTKSDATPTVSELLGPWSVAGPALDIGAKALSDHQWAETTRLRLTNDAKRLDVLVQSNGGKVVGGTPLFRLYDVGDAAAWQDKLAKGHVWSRIFPYSKTWLRLGLPHPDKWAQLEAAL